MRLSLLLWSAAMSAEGSEFVLVRWVEDESYGVMPLSAVPQKEREDVYPGQFTRMKWQGKMLYDVEVLKVSSNRSSLSKLCDDIINFKTTREDILEEDEWEVSTTDTEFSPVIKRPKISKKPALSKAKKVKKVDPKLEAAAKRAKEIFSKIRPPVSSEEDDDDDILTPTTQEKSAPQKLFSTSSSSIDSSKQIAALKRQIELLQKQVCVQPKSVSVTHNTVSHSNFESLNKNVHSVKDTVKGSQLDKWSAVTPGPGNDMDWCDISSGPSGDVKQMVATPEPTKKGCTKGYGGGSARPGPLLPGNSKKQGSDGYSTPKLQYKVEPSMVELVPGYGVQLSQRQLDVAIDNSSGSATKLIRNLMSVFFSRETLASSSALGGRQNLALDQDIVGACIRFVLSKHDVAKSTLIDCINDKCANARRISKKKPKE